MLSSRVPLLTTFLLGLGGLLSACDGNPFTLATGEDRDASLDSSVARPASGGTVGADARAPSSGRGGGTVGADARAPSSGRGGATVEDGGTREGGGATAGGASGQGGASGGARGSGGTGAAGGAAGSGGAAGTGGAAGSGGVPNDAFPSTPVLDDFGRQALGQSWTGETDSFGISNGTLGCALCGAPVLWSHEFGESQEAYFKIAGFDANSTELNVVMKAQSTNCDQIEILYAPDAGQIRVDYCYDGQWRERASVVHTLHLGDRFGGRAHADGTVEVFVNGAKVAAYDLHDYPFARGRIGVSGIASAGSVNAIDDFGGGDF